MRQQLEETIDHLRDQIAQAEAMDTVESEELRRALEEIASTLDETEIDSASLAERLHEETQSFQDSHPLLTQTVGRLAEMLSQMGI